jgi:predicted DNA-binding transcriptional regulator AlpA
MIMPKYLTVVAVAARYSVSVNTVWRWVREKRLPAPEKLSPGCSRWQTAVLEEHDKARAA